MEIEEKHKKMCGKQRQKNKENVGKSGVPDQSGESFGDAGRTFGTRSVRITSARV